MSSKSVPSVEQRFALLAKLGGQLPWERFTAVQVQAAMKSPEHLSRMAKMVADALGDPEFLIAALNAAAIQIPALPRPTLPELQAKWDWIREIESDTSPTGPVVFQLTTVLLDDDGGQIGGEEYERRLKALVSQFGYQQLAWLVEHQDEHPAFQALLGLIYVDGPAIIVVDRGGDRRVAYLDQDDERWDLGWGWLRSDFPRNGRVAVSGK